MGTKQFDNYADLITFTRASGATYLDSDGVLKTASTNIPRIEYDADGNRLGLLVEEQRTNLRTYSTAPNASNAYRIYGTYEANSAIAPDGTISAAKIVCDGDNSKLFDNYPNDYGQSSGATQTYSFYIKPINATYVTITQGLVGARLTFSTLQVTSVSGGSGSIVAVGNGWYRVSGTQNKGNIYHFWDVSLDSSTSGAFIWGVQLEIGAFPTSYIPTSGSTATRAADVASITGADFKKWFNAGEGTLVASIVQPPASGNRTAAFIYDGTTADNRIELRAVEASNAPRAYINANAASQCDFNFSAISEGQSNKMAIAYAVNNFAATVNGGSVQTDTSGIVPTSDLILIIGNATTSYLNSHIKSIKYYPRRLSNAQLQELTQ